MKKLLVGVLAALCCLAITAPVIAETKVGGMITSDMYYWDRSKERILGGLLKNATTVQDDWATTRMVMPQAWNRLWVDYRSDDKNLAGYIQLRTGGQKGNSGGVANENIFTWEYAWIDWHFNPNFYLRIGRQTQAFAIYTPDQNMGHVDGHIIGSGFGNIHGGTSRDAIRAYIKFNDNVRMEVQLQDPNTEADAQDELNLPRQTGLAGNALEANKVPRFDLAVPIKVGNFNIEPSFSYMKQNWDQVAAGSDDSFDIWGLALGAKAAFGPVTLSGEITYGENLGSGTYVGAGNGAPITYLNTLGQTKIEDGKTLAWWFEFSFNFGPAAIQAIVGMDKGKNDGDPTIARDASEWSRSQWMYGFQVPIYVAKNFTVTPAIWFYDYDGSATVGGAAGSAGRAGIDTDFGSETMIGVQFALTF